MSRKGSIDEPIRPLVEIMNSCRNYYTTSTCSGRISLIEKPRDNPAVKKGGNFLLNSHEKINFEKFHDLIETSRNANSSEQDHQNNTNTCVWLKFEPFIMHVQCLDLEASQNLLRVALGAGCRNSGTTFGKAEKFLVAVRSTSSMEVPIYCPDEFELDQSYIRFLVNECNRRLQENFERLERFQNNFESILKRSSN